MTPWHSRDLGWNRLWRRTSLLQTKISNHCWLQSLLSVPPCFHLKGKRHQSSDHINHMVKTANEMDRSCGDRLWRGRKGKEINRRERSVMEFVCLLVGCLTSQQQASVSQGRICSDNFTCCHTEREVADPTFYLTQSQYTDTGLTSPSADPRTPGARQGSHWSANV